MGIQVFSAYSLCSLEFLKFSPRNVYFLLIMKMKPRSILNFKKIKLLSSTECLLSVPLVGSFIHYFYSHSTGNRYKMKVFCSVYFPSLFLEKDILIRLADGRVVFPTGPDFCVLTTTSLLGSPLLL